MTKKDIGYYMGLPYKVEVYPEPDGSGYTAVIPELPGCMTCADNLEEIWDMIEEAKRGWLEISLEDGDYIPEPEPVEVVEYSGRFVVRLPTSLHQQLAKRAEREDTSLNQLVVMLLAESMGRWRTREPISMPHHKPEQVVKPFQRAAFEVVRQSIAGSTKRSEGSACGWKQSVSAQSVPVVG